MSAAYTDPADALALLHDLLDTVSPGWAAVDVPDMSRDYGSVVRFGEVHRPTHAVVSCEGDPLGCGMSEISAIAAAIEREIIELRDDYHELRDAVRTERRARRCLEDLV